jgi:hypothetical protein
MNEYLEALFERSFDREAGQEERVVSSLPFFVAALALTVNVLGYIATKLPAFQFSAYSLITYGFMAAAAALVIGALWWLFVGVRQRVYRLPPKETDLLEWATELRQYYSDKNLNGRELEDAVIADLRETTIKEFAESAVHNRAQNARRVFARTQGITLIVIQLALAFAMVAIIFVHDQIAASPTEASTVHGPPAAANATALAATNAATLRPETAAAQAAVHCRGGQNPRCETVTESGKMTNKPSAPSQPTQPAQPAQQSRPVAPQPQYFKKSADSGPITKR